MGTIMARRQHKDGSMSSAPMKAEKSSLEDGSVDPRHAAAEDVISAMNEKSPQRLMEAWLLFMIYIEHILNKLNHQSQTYQHNLKSES